MDMSFANQALSVLYLLDKGKKLENEVYPVPREIDDEIARAETDAERTLLARLQGGCQVPVGARAQVWGEELVLRALVATPDGKSVIRAEGRDGRYNAAALGRRVADDLLARGGAPIVARFREMEGSRQ